MATTSFERFEGFERWGRRPKSCQTLSGLGSLERFEGFERFPDNSRVRARAHGKVSGKSLKPLKPLKTSPMVWAIRLCERWGGVGCRPARALLTAFWAYRRYRDALQRRGAGRVTA